MIDLFGRKALREENQQFREEVERLREENSKLLAILAKAHGIHIASSGDAAPTVPIVRPKRAPWAVLARRIERTVASMPPEEVKKRLAKLNG